MKKRQNPSAATASLRRSAAKRLQRQKPVSTGPQSEAEKARLMHELQNLQSELEIQNEELRLSRERMCVLAAHAEAVREEERSRLARDLHDELAQELTRLKIDLVWLQRRLRKPGKAASVADLATRVAEMTQMADTAIHCVQRIATGLRPAVLDSLGLCAAVEWQGRDFQKHAGISCQLSVPKEEMSVARDFATTAFRILQESLTNVQRHAKATSVKIVLRQDAGQLLLTIQDNGCGIDPEKLSDPMSIGLAGMRERTLLLGGQCAIRSRPRRGTTIKVRLPLEAPVTGSIF
jgi:signal transduction histidine kinase